MPRIIIKENEQEVMGVLDPTENVVLVPLVCKRGSGDEEPVYYKASEKSKFIANFSTKVISEEVKVGDVTKTVNELSYYYICMLMNYGLNIIVKPLLYTTEVTAALEEKVIKAYVNERVIGNDEAAPCFENFKDKNLYNIKFITTGAHANLFKRTEAAENAGISGSFEVLATLAHDRTDCIALIELESDVTCDASATVHDTDDIKNVLRGEPLSADIYNYAACVFPWGEYNIYECTTAPTLEMPGSFGYLSAFANSVQTNANWYAAAGVTRGTIPSLLKLKCDIGESQMHILLNENATGDHLIINVNPIMRISEYGSKIWGNRVARYNVDSDLFINFLNVRMLLCDIKKQIYNASIRVTFEPNDMITWLNFQQLTNTLLDSMKGNRGIEWYSWRRQATTEKATIKAILTIKPIEAVEYFDITINLSNEQVEVTEI